jgi:flavin reductase (DIM6/NTAB) family NADH-FMN oxidoreductase RutF/DNA-binding MarR family transcriptional regulator
METHISPANSLEIGALIYTDISTAQATLRAVVESCGASLSSPVSADDYAVLRLLQKFPTLELNLLSDLLVLQRVSARQILARLAERGLLSVARKVNDRRIMDCVVTPAGHELLAEAEMLPGDAAFSQAVDQLSSQERAALGQELDVLRRSICSDLLTETTIDESGADFVKAWANGSSFIALHELWLSLVRVYRCVRAEQTRFLSAASGNQLDTGTYMALYRLHESACSLGEVASFLRVDQNTAIKILDRLEANNLITRERNPNNRRQALISANNKGLRLLNAIPPLDPKGAYLNVIRSLSDGGGLLAEILRRLLNEVLKKPIVNQALFSGLLKRVQETAEFAREKVNPLDYRRAMSRFLTGVAVISIADENGPRGVTVNSLTSVSLEPAILLICFDRRSPSLRRLRENSRFSVNILTSDQRDLARRFGARESAENSHSLEPDSWKDAQGVPILTKCLASIICDFAQSYEAGTHTIVLAEPREIIAHGGAHDEASALGYWQSSYVSVLKNEPESEPGDAKTKAIESAGNRDEKMSSGSSRPGDGERDTKRTRTENAGRGSS